MADPTDDYSSQLAAIQQQLALAQRMQANPGGSSLIQTGGVPAPDYGSAFTSAVRQVKSNSDVKRLSEQQAQLQQAILDHARQNATNGMVQLTHNDTDQINPVEDGEAPTPLAPGHLPPDPQAQQHATDQATAYGMMDPLSAQKDIAQRLLDRANPQPYNLGPDQTRFVDDQPVAKGVPRGYAADHMLVKIVDPSKPEGYRTILRSQFDASKDNEWTAPRSAGMGAGLDLTPQQNEALFGANGAVASGRLSPDRINSRTAKLLANAYILNPNTDMNALASDASMMRNPTYMGKQISLTQIPEILNNVVNAGKKVNFPDNRWAGEVEAYAKGLNNDPDFVNYMVQRNDALLAIASTMRGQGMSDFATKLEEEAAHKTMSPRALDAWLAGQMASLRPRLQNATRLVRPGNRPPTAPIPATFPSPGLPGLRARLLLAMTH